MIVRITEQIIRMDEVVYLVEIPDGDDPYDAEDHLNPDTDEVARRTLHERREIINREALRGTKES